MSYKIGKSLGLENMSVNIVDTTYLSSYFNITEFNPVFGAGKNLLVVNTSKLLSPSPNIQIEARDSKNNYLYIESAIYTDKTSNSQKYYYSLHVYDNLVSGPGKVTIVGNDVNGKKVKWSANIVITTTSENKSKVVLYNKPQLVVFPIITNTLSSSVEINPKTLTGSFTSVAINPSRDFDTTNNYNPNNIDYRIVDGGGQFQTGMESFPITLYVNQIKTFNSTAVQNVSDTASILVKGVLNKNTLLLSDPYIYQNNKISEISSGSYSCLFNNVKYNPSYFNTSSYAYQVTDFSGDTRLVKNSYALVGYTNLGTFSGVVNKHKIYKQDLSTAGDYQLVVDELFSKYELLQDITTPNKSFERLGAFYTQSHINNFWFTSSNNFGLYYDNNTFLNGMVISGSVNNGYIIAKVNTSYTNRNPSYLPFNSTQNANFSGSSYDCNFLHFYPNSKYTLSLNAAFLQKNLSDVASILFYITSSSPNIANEVNYDSAKGVLVGSLNFSSSANSTIYNAPQTFDFSFLNETYGTLVIYCSNFSSSVISNVSISPTNTFGFSEDVYFTKVPFDVSKPNDIFDIKAELYDKDGTLAYNDLATVQYFDPNGLTSPISFISSTTITATTLSSSNLITSTIYATSITGSVYGTSSRAISASYALTASYALNGGGGGASLTTGSTYPITSSWAVTSSYAQFYNVISSSILSSSYASSSYSSSYALTASYALNGGGSGTSLTTGSTYPITSSWANNVISASYSLTASFAPFSYTLPSSITASFTGSLTGSVLGTSSWSNNSVTASYLLGSVTSASYALTASYAPSSYILPSNITASFTGSLTGSVFGTSSWSNNSISSSYSLSSSFTISASYAPSSYTLPSSITASFTGSLTGSVFGTSSYSNNSTSASYSLTSSFVTSASYAPLVLPNTINTTASWSNNSLTASYVSASNIKGNIISASYALTSSFATSASYAPNTGGTSLTTGSTYPITSSWSVSSSYVNAANVDGTVISASYALSASYAPPVAGGTLGGSGTANYIPVWVDATDFGNSNIYTDGTNTAFNDTVFDGTAPEMLRVRGTTYNIISGRANINNYAQLNIVNVNSGANASADIVATNNAGNESGNYVDMGINSSQFSGYVGLQNDAYVYATGSNFYIGNVTVGGILGLFAGGNTNTASVVLLSNGNFGIGTPNPINVLQVQGNVSASSFTGSVLGTSSYTTSASYAPSSYVLPNSITASFTGSLTGSVFGTSSWSNNSLTSSNILGGSNNYIPLWSGSSSLTSSILSQSNNTMSMVGSLSISGSILNNGVNIKALMVAYSIVL